MTTVTQTGAPYFGVFNIGDPLDYAAQFTANAGVSPGIMHVHTDWALRSDDGGLDFLTFRDSAETGLPGEGSMLDLATSLAQNGTILAVSWDPLAIAYRDNASYTDAAIGMIPLDEILSGQHDAYIAQVAQQVADLGVPMLMNLFGEANAAALFGYGENGDTYRNISGDETGAYGDPTLLDGPERVRDVFRHVIDIFDAQGADNVTWFQYVGTDYGIAPDTVSLSQLYAGDSYIDWVGGSVYPTSVSEIGEAISGSYNAWGAITDNPFFIPELGITSGTTTDFAALLQELTTYDRLIAATYADSDYIREEYNIARIGEGPNDWSFLAGFDGFTNTIQVGDGTQNLSDWYAAAGITYYPNEVQGTDGVDILEGTSPHDRLVGGNGNDIYIIDSADDVIVETSNGGTDTVYTSTSYRFDANVEEAYAIGTSGLSFIANDLDNLIVANGASNVISTGAGADTIMAAGGTDEVFAGAGADSIFAGLGNDTIRGEAGDDLLEGMDGNDTLDGGAGSDVMDGGAGNDRIILSDGADYAIGGAGADLFIFEQTGAIAGIADFDVNNDRLDLRPQDIGSLSELNSIAFDTGDGVFLSNNGNSLFLEGVTLAQLDSDNLIFAA